MKGVSAKRIYAYISLALSLLFLTFIIICKSLNVLENLFTVKTCETYYMLSFMGLAAVAYALDSESNKEPAILVLYLIPIFSFMFITLCFIVLNKTIFTLIAGAILVLILVGMYFFRKKILPNIMLKKNGYQVFIFLFTIIFLSIILVISFAFLY